jgi:hypothetical protein
MADATGLQNWLGFPDLNALDIARVVAHPDSDCLSVVETLVDVEFEAKIEFQDAALDVFLRIVPPFGHALLSGGADGSCVADGRLCGVFVDRD